MASVTDPDVGQVVADDDGRAIAARDTGDWTDRLRTFAAIAIGAGVPIAGFPPVNTMTDRLDVGAHAATALLAPAFLLVYFAVFTAWRAPSPDRAARAPRALLIGGGLLIVGAGLSLLETDALQDSLGIGLLGLLAPLLLCAAVRRADLPLGVVVWSFLVASSLLLLRADLVFLGDYGPPSGVDLYNAKFSNAAYDFHYYGLGNPDQTATFTLVPFAISAWLISDRDPSRWSRRAAAVVFALTTFTLVLLYVRFPLAIAAVIGLVALWRSPAGRSLKLGLVGAFALLAVRFVADDTTLDYLKKLFDTGSDASGVERASSIFDGFAVLGDHPFTGVGLGRFGFNNDRPPAHSAVAQVAADLGVVGLIGVLLVLASMVWLAVGLIRRRESTPGLTVAVGCGLGIYAIAATLVGGATAGVAIGFVTVWGMAVGLLLAVVTAPARSPAWAPESLRSGPAAAAAFERGWRRVRGRVERLRPRSRTVEFPGMGLYGLLLALGLILYLDGTLPAQIELIGTRLDDLNGVFAGHAAGKGPLVGLIEGEGFYPSGMADNPGLYWVLPGFADLLGINSATSAFRTFSIAIQASTVAVAPTIAARLFRSTLAGVVVPLTGIWLFRFFNVGDIYFMLAFAAAVGFPLLLLVDRNWKGSRPIPPAALIGVMMFASTMSMFRNGAGTPLLVVALAVVWLHTKWRHRLPALLICVVAFFSVSHGVMRGVEAVRASNMGNTPIAGSQRPIVSGADSFDDELKRRSVPFHLLYIGLGFDKNKYGIAYLDENAADYALSVDRKAIYGTPRYNEVLKDRYFEILREDPGFIASTTARKGLVVLDDSLSRFPLALLVIACVLFLTARRSRERRWTWLLLLGGASSLLYPLTVMPLLRYELSWLSALAWIVLLGIGWLAAAAQPQLARRFSDPALRFSLGPIGRFAHWSSALPGRARDGLVTATVQAGDHVTASASRMADRPVPATGGGALLTTQQRDRVRQVDRRRWIGAGAVALALIIGVSIAAKSPQRALLSGTSPTTAYDLKALLKPLKAWDMMDGLPRKWTSLGADIEPGHGRLEVETSDGVGAYQLAGPEILLQPGSYISVVRGGLTTGGMLVGVLDTSTQQWLATSRFLSDRLYSDRVAMPVSFTITTPTRVQPVLANYTDGPARSQWLIDDVSIRPTGATPAPTTEATPDKPRPPTQPLPPASTSELWDMSDGLPAGWNPNDAEISEDDGRLQVETTDTPNQYQLTSPPVSLRPGRYVAVAHGTLKTGGMVVGALNSIEDAFLATEDFVPDAAAGDKQPVTFTVETTTVVQIILANDKQDRGRSHWSLDRVTIRRLGGS